MPVNKNRSNILLCGTYYGLSQCVLAEQNKKTGVINSYETNVLVKSPKSISMSSQNAYYLSESVNSLTKKNDYVLYAASSWSINSQYLAAHSSKNMYQEEFSNKKIGGT